MRESLTSNSVILEKATISAFTILIEKNKRKRPIVKTRDSILQNETQIKCTKFFHTS